MSSQWLSIASAAAVLDLTPDALRRAIERRAVRALDGGTIAEWDGVRARKLGRLWRVLLGPSWRTIDPAVASTAREIVRDGRKRPS